MIRTLPILAVAFLLAGCEEAPRSAELATTHGLAVWGEIGTTDMCGNAGACTPVVVHMRNFGTGGLAFPTENWGSADYSRKVGFYLDTCSSDAWLKAGGQIQTCTILFDDRADVSWIHGLAIGGSAGGSFAVPITAWPNREPWATGISVN